MKQIWIAFVACFAWGNGTMAHFSFVVPQEGTTANLIMSESLKPDGDVDVAVLGGAKLWARDALGKETPLALKKGDNAFELRFDRATRVIHGVVDLGWTKRGKAPPHVLVYYPKTIVGDAFDANSAVGAAAPVEIVPSGRAGAVRFEVRVLGKAAAGVEVTVIQPDGKEAKVTTEVDGRTKAFEQRGRYGAWTRYFQDSPGERDGKQYEQVRNYGLLVTDVVDVASTGDAQRPAFARLPEATSSFGGLAMDGWLYVYGGHVAPTHTYHTTAVSGRFHRLNLADGRTWESLPGGRPLQGMNLAAHGGKIYRVGGMQPRNKEGEKADNYSVADVARFDPATKTWEALPPLPEGRSSHDVAVVGNTLYVIGGWNMKGRVGGNDWLGTMLSLNLSEKDAAWKTIKQPFERRALIVAVQGEKIYVIGGFDEESEPIRKVDVYDVARDAWTSGPALPGKEQHGFAPAACTHGGRLYVSVGDGTMYRMDETGTVWVAVARTTPRIVHRLTPYAREILVVGGADKGANSDLIEAVNVGSIGGDAATASERIPANAK